MEVASRMVRGAPITNWPVDSSKYYIGAPSVNEFMGPFLDVKSAHEAYAKSGLVWKGAKICMGTGEEHIGNPDAIGWASDG